MLNSSRNKGENLFMVADFTAMVIVFPFKTCLDLLGFNISKICNFSFKEEVNILLFYGSYSGNEKLKVEAII